MPLTSGWNRFLFRNRKINFLWNFRTTTTVGSESYIRQYRIAFKYNIIILCTPRVVSRVRTTGLLCAIVGVPDFTILRLCSKFFFIVYMGSANRVENVIISFDFEITTRSHTVRPLYLLLVIHDISRNLHSSDLSNAAHFLFHAKNYLGKRCFPRIIQIIKFLIVLVVFFLIPVSGTP